MMCTCNEDVMKIAEMYDHYQKAVCTGKQEPAFWAASLTGNKRAFCLFLQREGGRRKQLNHGTIVCYVELLSACSAFVQHFLQIEADFYELSNPLDLKRLFVLMQANDFYQYFSNFLSGSPKTVINRYLDFIR